ncbi:MULTISPECIES: DinB family protein [unclassified Arthrobacter]|uniref:DinB family protein n=1 Tax=unclassified Arthrobacter TaxID=235627 RepID=UPI001E2E2CA8|nr:MULTISPECIES: DinB family protein [unclassified Arthrobacter]MCC9145616.1 DinB family protein [Arthrobacter sp. zg-Y919]MDK1276845.1 DinB family protein [Arthrobacter sp. zg.Y919]WIB04217.1 DinB family protein [Arthrobacter sp. zg-Y919]
MTEQDPAPKIEPPLAGTEIETLLGSLDRQRATFAWKTGGLDTAGLTATVGASAITLGGLLKHLAGVEAVKFTWQLRRQDPGAPWNAADWEHDPDWDWRTAADDTPEELYALWSDAVGRSRQRLAAALDDGGLDQLLPAIEGQTGSLRRMLIDLIEEYARHVGHADLIREAVDGLVGEDPPGDVSWPAPAAAVSYPAPTAGA